MSSLNIRRRPLALLAAAAAALISLAACSAAPAATTAATATATAAASPAKGGTITYGRAAATTSFDLNNQIIQVKTSVAQSLADQYLLQTRLDQARAEMETAERRAGLAVDRGRIVREALSVVIADLESRGESSTLVRKLREG